MASILQQTCDGSGARCLSIPGPPLALSRIAELWSLKCRWRQPLTIAATSARVTSASRGIISLICSEGFNSDKVLKEELLSCSVALLHQGTHSDLCQLQLQNQALDRR